MRPIGVFDSGVGSLSVLLALRAELPDEQFIYIADSGHAPYGERDDTYVIHRSPTIARHLVQQHRIKALVVACNKTRLIGAACAHYTGAMGRFGLNSDEIDTLVLDCTHYPFAAEALQTLVIE